MGQAGQRPDDGAGGTAQAHEVVGAHGSLPLLQVMFYGSFGNLWIVID
jgi:hypothetical protein